MPKSRKRGGEKAHRRRIQKTNNLRKSTFMKQKKLFNEMMKEELEKAREKYSGETENNTSTDETTGFIQSTETL